MNSGSDYMDLIVFNSKKGCETFIIQSEMPFNNLLDAVLKSYCFMYFLIHHNIFFYKRYLVAVGGEKLFNKR